MPLRWPAGVIPVDLSLDAPAMNDAAARAFSTFASAMGKMAPDIELGIVVRTSKADGDDGLATVTWQIGGFDDDADPDALALTVSTYDTKSGRITDADILLNANYAWWTGSGGCLKAYDVQAVLTHEIGHLFGLGHDKLHPDATMFPTADTCETMKRDLSETDLDGLVYLYETVGPAPAEGCSVARHGGRGALWPLLAPLALLLWRRRAWAVVALLFVAGTAQATTMRRVPLAAAGKASGIVVRGTVRETVARRIDGRIYTDAVLVVAERLKGDCAATVTIRQLGGELDGQGTDLEGTAALEAGDEVLVFLRARRDGAYAPVGMAQGVLRVERDALVRDLRGLELVGEGKPGLERLSREDVLRALAPPASGP